jgi:hypothetical protein
MPSWVVSESVVPQPVACRNEAGSVDGDLAATGIDMADDASLDRIADQVVAWARTLGGVCGVLLAGSAATGEMTANSDYDFVVVIDDAAPWPLPFRDGGRQTWIEDDGRQVEVAYTTVARYRRRCAEEEAAGSCWRRQGVARSRVLHSRDGSVESLIEEARRIAAAPPEPMPHQDVLWECYDIWNQLKDIEDRLQDEQTVRLLAAPLFAQLIGFFFRLDARWKPRPRDMLRVLAETDSPLHELAAAFLAAPSAAALSDALWQIARYLAESFGVKFEAGYVSTR